MMRREAPRRKRHFQERPCPNQSQMRSSPDYALPPLHSAGIVREWSSNPSDVDTV